MLRPINSNKGWIWKDEEGYWFSEYGSNIKERILIDNERFILERDLNVDPGIVNTVRCWFHSVFK